MQAISLSTSSSVVSKEVTSLISPMVRSKSRNDNILVAYLLFSRGMMKNNWLLSTVWVNFISGIVESFLYKRCAIALACCAHVNHRLSSRKAVNWQEI